MNDDGANERIVTGHEIPLPCRLGNLFEAASHCNGTSGSNPEPSI